MFTKLFLSFIALAVVFSQDDDDDDSSKKKKNLYDDPDPYKNLLNWLKDGKAEFSKVEIEVRSERYRTLKAKTHINKGEWVLFIPRTHFLTLDEVKKSCLINRKMIQLNLQPLSSQTYFANHLMQEKRRKNSFWKPYIDVLPKDVSGFPTYFNEEDLALLKGSPTLDTVLDQRNQFRQEFDNLVTQIPEMTRFKYTYDEFIKLRILINSRSFTVMMNKEHVQVSVPLADFINHDNNGFLEFDYNEKYDGFFMQAARDIRRGEELFYSYGKMSNKFFFMHYGFALDNIYMNQVDVNMCLQDNDPLYDLKISLTQGNRCFKYRLVNETDHGTFRECIGAARFFAVSRLDEFFLLEQKAQGYRYFNPGWHLYPISTPLEAKMWIWWKEFLIDYLKGFASTIEEDLQMLKDPELKEYRKHIIIVTLKEKQIIQQNIEVAELASQIVEKSSQELNNLIRFYQYQKVAGYAKQELIPMKVEANE